MLTAPADVTSLPPFKNEPYADFSDPATRRRMQAAVERVRSELGREWDLLIAGERVKTGDLLRSVNPSNPEQVVGLHHKATADLARKAVETAYARFEEWKNVPAIDRIGMLLRAAEIIRERKFEFNAWLAFEAGKTWPEAEAETAEAIDFCEYYARQMLRFLPSDSPCPVTWREGSDDVPAARCRS